MPEATSTKLPLFRDYPRLEDALPHVSLGIFPTPVQKLPLPGDTTGGAQVYIKRDDISGLVYGGNKVRKLEFLLADALRKGRREVMTVGFAGSNHAVATAIYARQVGMGSSSLLLPQRNGRYVRENLLAGCSAGARLKACGSTRTIGGVILSTMLRGRVRHRCLPAYIPAGGSCPLGAVGYVNAALELRDQVIAGEMPAPERIYVPLGSMGTSVGLSVGLQAAGLKTQVIAIRVIERRMVSESKVRRLFEQTRRLLRRHEPAFPDVHFATSALTIRDEFLGDGYASFTEAGARATALLRERAGIRLNGAYSAKAMAALLADAAQGLLAGKTVLFWNTYNSRDLTPLIDETGYERLPRAFHRYFNEDVQSLDTDAIRY